MSISSDFQKLQVAGMVTLYELDATKLGGDVMRWHGHVGFEDWELIDPTNVVEKRNIIWQGNTYEPVSIQSEGIETRGDGRASTPSLTLANNIGGTQGAVSAMCFHFNDFAGATLLIRRTLVKYLDAANFLDGNPTADPTQHIRPQTWYVEQKTSENNKAVSFELSNPVDFEGAQIPTRDITSFCHFAMHGRYRGHECGYMGVAMFTEDGVPTDDPTKDRCSGRLTDGCIIRFGENNPLPFGGFPSSSLIS